ncbi:MAG: hypothetical protein ACRDKA_00695 [Actinomycetota bacterium]
MIEAILISVIMFGTFAMGWLAHPFPPDPHPPNSDCCIGIPDIPDTPEELLRLSERKL